MPGTTGVGARCAFINNPRSASSAGPLCSLKWCSHAVATPSAPDDQPRRTAVASNVIRYIARAAWILPIFFAGLFVHQAFVAYGLRATLTEGQPAKAEVLEVHMENRVDVTYDYVSLRVELPDGQVITKEKMSLPHSLIQLLENTETVDVLVRPGAAQEVVIAQFGATQWRIAALNAAMALGAALVFGLGIYYWDRYLQREGEPSERGVTDPDPDHPAREITRA